MLGARGAPGVLTVPFVVLNVDLPALMSSHVQAASFYRREVSTLLAGLALARTRPAQWYFARTQDTPLPATSVPVLQAWIQELSLVERVICLSRLNSFQLGSQDQTRSSNSDSVFKLG
jgi:hypothetical protein